jgi:hypothetical protein
MTVADVVPTFLAACPSVGPAWRKHLDFWGGEPGRGIYMDVAVLARHLVDSYERGELEEFPAAFALVERCLTEGDEATRELATIGVIEGVQNIGLHRPFGADVFLPWLGPASRTAWDELNRWWGQLEE